VMSGPDDCSSMRTMQTATGWLASEHQNSMDAEVSPRRRYGRHALKRVVTQW
jgi:hypothetical protein